VVYFGIIVLWYCYIMAVLHWCIMVLRHGGIVVWLYCDIAVLAYWWILVVLYRCGDELS